MLPQNRSEMARAAMLVALALSAASCGSPRYESNADKKSHAVDSTLTQKASMTPVERGEYLTVIMGCHDCHTPGGLYGAPDFRRALAGSELGWKGPWGVSYASNLTPDSATGLGTWTEEEIIRALQAGVGKDGGPVAPPMPWPNFARLTRDDVTAIVAYLKSIPAVAHEVPESSPPGRSVTGTIIPIPRPGPWDAPRKQPS